MLETREGRQRGGLKRGIPMFRRILLAVDGSQSGEVAVSFVGGMARHSGAVVRVLLVNELLVGGRGYARLTDKEARAVVDDAVRALVVLGVPAVGEVRVGSPFDIAGRITEAATDWNADVIVLGSRRRRSHALLRRLPGSGVRDLVTSLSTLPTVIAPAPLRTGRGQRVVPDWDLAHLADLPSAPIS
jgi:nucleotide-binding universal stress UspA family protein